MKKCSRCEIEKPLTTEFYHRCSNMASGFKSDCKDCRNAINRIYQRSKPRKPLKNEEYWREYRREYYRGYYKKNKLKYKSNINKEYQKEYYHKNRRRFAEYYERNKDRKRAYQKEYYIKNNGREKGRLRKNRRDAIKKSLLHTFTAVEWSDCLKEFDNKCAYCGERKKSFHQDHFIPISKGGEYTKYNIVPTCETCNKRKSDRDFKEWYTEQDFYDPKREERVLKYLKYKNELQQISLF